MDRIAKSVRSAYGKTLVELGKSNPNIVVLDADLSCSTQTKEFMKVFPNRFFNVGIAEQDLMTTSAGLACTGKIVFASTFAMFATGRAWDQIRNTIAYSNLNVKICATHGGITVGEDGASHQALEDISLMRNIPNMVVIVPADVKETEESVKFAAQYDGPVYIRIARTNLPDVYDETYSFNYKKAKIMKEGRDISIITNGETLIEVLDAEKELRNFGINAEIISMPVVKPIDSETIIQTAKKTNFVITVENHSVIGGLGSSVCEVLSENYPSKVCRIGINDEFGQSGNSKELMDFYGLSAKKLSEKIIRLIKDDSVKKCV